jgi:protein-S-isoprenylcysteine O-methyltransferase
MSEPADNLHERLQEREAMKRLPLEMIPVVNSPGGNIPNTPLTVSLISFILGSLFSLGSLTFFIGGFDSSWWATYQLGFFVAAWSGFHWGEFAVTAGWNFEKCSVDCEHLLLALPVNFRLSCG